MRSLNRGGCEGGRHDENIAPDFFRHPCLASRARQRPTEAGVFEDELHLEIGVSNPVSVHGGTPELEEVRTSARPERQGENGCRDFGANDLRRRKGQRSGRQRLWVGQVLWSQELSRLRRWLNSDRSAVRTRP